MNQQMFIAFLFGLLYLVLVGADLPMRKPFGPKMCDDIGYKQETCCSYIFDPIHLSCKLMPMGSNTETPVVLKKESPSQIYVYIQKNTTRCLNNSKVIGSSESILKSTSEQPTFSGNLLAVPHISEIGRPLYQAHLLSLNTLNITPYKQLKSRRIVAMVFIPKLNILVLSKSAYLKQIFSFDFKTVDTVKLAKYAPLAFGLDNERLMIFFFNKIKNKEGKKWELFKLHMDGKQLETVKIFNKHFISAIAVNSHEELLYSSYKKVIFVFTYDGKMMKEINIPHATSTLCLDSSKYVLYLNFKKTVSFIQLNRTSYYHSITQLSRNPRQLVTNGHQVYISYWQNTWVTAVKWKNGVRISQIYVDLKGLGHKGLQICLIE